MSGRLLIVGTPIGNLDDITLRALRALREADIIAAEDTRRTAQLLARHGISLHALAPAATHPRSPQPHRRLVSYHEFNEAKRTEELLQELQNGKTVALVSDAGMPTISDPGQRLIAAVVQYNADCRARSPEGHRADPAKHNPAGTERREGCHPEPVEGSLSFGKKAEIPRQARNDSLIELEIIPGPSAVTMAIAAGSASVSLAGNHGAFLFYGFLPHKPTQRRKVLTELAPLPYSLVFFESPYRLVKSLRDMHELLGNRRAVVARELTKKFEEIIRGDLAAILKKLENRSVKGEITVVVEGRHG